MNTDTPLAQLEAKFAALDKQHDQLVSNFNVVIGAKNILEQLIAEAKARAQPVAKRTPAKP